MSALREALRKLKRAKDEIPKLRSAIAREVTPLVLLRIEKQMMSGAGYAPISDWTPKFNQYSRVTQTGGVPLIDTGDMLKNNKVETSNNPGGFRITAYNTSVQAGFLQHGGTTSWNTDVPARPFIKLAMESIPNLLKSGKICEKQSRKYFKTIFES